MLRSNPRRGVRSSSSCMSSTSVAVTMGARSGKVTIAFADLEDLERIYHLVTDGDATL